MGAVVPWRPAPRSLAEVRDPDEGAEDLYPRRVLEGAETALCLFSAAFWGRQDAYWLAEVGLRTTCVDTDGAKLAAMRALYPSEWGFYEEDAFEFAELARLSVEVGETDGRWGVVSLDPFTNLIDRCAQNLPLWCSLARRAIILGTLTHTKVSAPDGWRITERVRRSEFSGGVYWTVLEPA